MLDDFGRREAVLAVVDDLVELERLVDLHLSIALLGLALAQLVALVIPLRDPSGVRSGDYEQHERGDASAH